MQVSHRGLAGDALGCLDDVVRCRTIVAKGTSADAQLAVYRQARDKGAEREEALAAPAVIRAMAELSIRSLPLAMAVRGTAQPHRIARLVLTGAGGGEWTFACGPGEPENGAADVVIRASVVDWCRRFADRLEPDAVPIEVDGDAELAKDLVRAANAFAGL